MTDMESKGIRLAELCCQLRDLWDKWDAHTTEYGRRKREIEIEVEALAREIINEINTGAYE